MLRILTASILTIATLAATPRPAHAQCQAEWRTSPGQAIPGLGTYNWQVGYTLCVHDDGTGPALYVGGNFSQAGHALAEYVARWNGEAWAPVGSGFDNHVTALAVYYGNLIAGGRFTTSGDTTVNGIARWDGTAWLPLGAGVAGVGDAVVLDLAVWNGDLIAGGRFTSMDGVAANNIARWNGTSWGPLGEGFDSHVGALTVHGGDLIAGGYFENSGAVPTNHIARWNSTEWVPLGAGFDDGVLSLTSYGDQLIAGGYFLKSGQISVNGVARWDGTAWLPLGNGMSSGNRAFVWSLGVHEGDLIAGGRFIIPGYEPRESHIARWDGKEWSALGAGLDSSVYAIGAFGGRLIVTGWFFGSSNRPIWSIAQWDGETWLPVTSGITDASSPMVTALGSYDDDVIVGGRFAHIGAVQTNYIARWNGSTLSPLGSGLVHSSSTPSVSALLSYNGELVVGGSFTQAGDITTSGIARWDGSSWGDLGGGVSGRVAELVIYQDELVAAGNFLTAGGINAQGIAKWDGVSWGPLSQGSEDPTGTIVALTVRGAELFAGGWFTLGGGSSAYQVARWDGTSWSLLGSAMNGSVIALTIHDGDLIAGGGFTLAGGTTANHVARWNGNSWTAMGTGIPGSVPALAVYHGELFAGSSASSGDTLSRWNGESWEPTGNSTSSISALAVHNDELLAGGGFSYAGGLPSYGWARYWSPVPLKIGQQPAGQAVLDGQPVVLGVAASGHGTLSYQWRKDGEPVSDGGGLSGATTATLSIAAAGPADAGAYDVLVTDECTTLASQVAAVAVNPPGPPALSAAVSRRTHGQAGSFDIDVVSGGAVECRTGGPTLLVATFDRAVQGVDGLDTGDVAVSGATVTGVSIAGGELQVELDAASGSTIAVSFPGIANAAEPGSLSADALCFGILAGDATGDRAVNIFDLIAVRNGLNQPVDASRFRDDLNADGLINIFDLINVRNIMNTTAPACP